MRVPELVKEIVWTFYPPRYKQLSEQSFAKSLRFMSKMLLIAFLITGVLYVPKLLLLKGTIQEELSKFDMLQLSGNVSQSAPVTIPRHNPWVVVDLNSNLTLKKEIFAIDQQSVQYRFLNVRKLPREQLKDFAEYRATISSFLSALLILLLPGIALILYIRTWLKYFLIIAVMATLFFILAELTRYRLRWKQMANIAAHALTPVIFIEVVSSFITTKYLLPIIPFLGVHIYFVSLLIVSAMMVMGIVGCHYEARKKR